MMMDTCRNAARAVLRELRPQTLLCIGGACGSCPELTSEATVLPGRDPLGELAGLGRFDFALVVDALDSLPKRIGEQLLARLRDLHGGHFAVQLPAESQSHWSDNDLRALGLILLARCGGETAPTQLWGFDIQTYKPTPEWLNPEFWAHPERWDRYWW